MNDAILYMTSVFPAGFFEQAAAFWLFCVIVFTILDDWLDWI